MGITPFPPPDGFGLRPFLLDGIEIWAVGRKKLDSVSPLFNGSDDIRSFVEGGPVQNDDSSIRRYWQECIPHPTQENVGVDVAVPKIHRQKCE
jgi:hypothetical protein